MWKGAKDGSDPPRGRKVGGRFPVGARLKRWYSAGNLSRVREEPHRVAVIVESEYHGKEGKSSMNLSEAIQTLQRLPKEKQTDLIRAIEAAAQGTVLREPSEILGTTGEHVPRFLRSALGRIEHMGRDISSEDPSGFAGR